MIYFSNYNLLLKVIHNNFFECELLITTSNNLKLNVSMVLKKIIGVDF